MIAVRDYKTGKIKNISTGKESETGLPASNVLYFELTDNAWVCVRPSGTEPKLKLYYGICGKSADDADAIAARMEKALKELF